MTHLPKGLSRRNFLKGSAYLGGTAAIFGQSPFIESLARAHTHPDAADHYYIFCYFGGAWDILLGLEPRDPLLYNLSNMRLTGIQPGYELLNSSDGHLVVKNEMTFGPHIGDLANHSDKLCSHSWYEYGHSDASSGPELFPNGQGAFGLAGTRFLCELLAGVSTGRNLRYQTWPFKYRLTTRVATLHQL